MFFQAANQENLGHYYLDHRTLLTAPAATKEIWDTHYFNH